VPGENEIEAFQSRGLEAVLFIGGLADPCVPNLQNN